MIDRPDANLLESDMDPKKILQAARDQFEKELFDTAVHREVDRLRKQSDRSLWQRLLDKLPFTITWKTP